MKTYTEKKIQKIAAKVDADVIHMVHHGKFNDALCKPELLKEKQLWVSFHDHYSIVNTTAEKSKALWQKAHRRLVISAELGHEYCLLFGNQPYEIITDGLGPDEVSPPRAVNEAKLLIIYFSGLLHLEYYPLFGVLADALDQLSLHNTRFKLVLRGTQHLSLLNNRKFQTEYRTDFVSDADIKKEQDEADILYLPIKFDIPAFYRYSLSTKMVGYLGAPGAILYHGPDDAAACRLLKTWDAAVCCGTLDVTDLAGCLKALLAGTQVSVNAKKLARARFDMNGLRAMFWDSESTKTLQEQAAS